MSLVGRVVSGGQTGADRAALDAAVAAGVPYAGWCPAGGLAEDLPEPPGLLGRYPGLQETPSPDPAERTRLNVRDSDAVLVVRAPEAESPGTDLTVATAAGLGRHCLVTDGRAPGVVRTWLEGLADELGRPLVLDVAGPRESEQPGVYEVTRALLDRLLGE